MLEQQEGVATRAELDVADPPETAQQGLATDEAIPVEREAVELGRTERADAEVAPPGGERVSLMDDEAGDG